MASRLALPKVPRVEIPLDPRVWREAGRRALGRWPASGPARRRLIWRALTAPYWFASDVPVPHLPTREARPPAAGLAGDQVVRLLNEIARRVWIQRALTILARSAWLGLLVGCLWLLIELQGGPAFDMDTLIWIAVALAVPGVVFAALARPTRRQVARMLDRSFGLQERMMTAVDNLGKGVPSEGERAPLVYLQMADAANVVAQLRKYPAFAVRPPVRELVLAIATALLLASLYFLRGVGGGIPPVEANAVPPFQPAAERLVEPDANQSPAGALADAPTTAEVQQRARRSGEARQDLLHLARALDDHAVTRSAADAIDRGEYHAAADELRTLADQADELSPAAREALAQDLDSAASQMSKGSRQLSDAARQAADGLREGSTPAQEGMRRLGDAVESTGREIASQQELAEQMRQAQAAEASRSGASDTGGSSGQSAASSDVSSDSADGQRGEWSDSQSGEPGQGADAQPGQGDESGQSGQSQDGEISEGDPHAAGQRGLEDAAQAGQSGTDPGQQPGEQPGAGDLPADQGQGQQGQAINGDGAQQGAGAGSGHEDNPSEGERGAQTGGQQQAGEGEPAADQVTEGELGEGQGNGAETDPREAITLSRSPEGQSVQTGSGGGSSVGAGPGASVSGGTSVQGEVGEAGPDSNRVPPSYRSVVEAYFSDPGSP